MMPYSLWRNNVCLGQIVLPFPTSQPQGIAGMLSPTPAYADISVTFQVRSPVLPGHPVQQFSEADYAQGGRFPLRPVSEEDLNGARAADIIELRDDEGEPVPVDMIMVQRFEVGPSGQEGSVRDACDALGIEPTGWVVFASRDELTSPG